MAETIAKKDILDFLDDETAEQIAKEIKEALCAEASEKTLTCQFDIQKGKMAGDDVPNTWFVFDAKPGDMIDDFKKALFARDINDFEDLKVSNFIIKTSDILVEKYNEDIRETVRRVLMPDHNVTRMPLERIVVETIEVVDFTSIPLEQRYLLKIKKDPDPDGEGGDTQTALKTLSDLAEASPGVSLEVLFSHNRYKREFRGIIDIEVGEKYLHEVTLVMFIDYSVSDGFLKALEEKDVEELKKYEI